MPGSSAISARRSRAALQRPRVSDLRIRQAQASRPRGPLGLRRLLQPATDPSFQRATEGDRRALALGRELQQSSILSVRSIGRRLVRATGAVLQRKERRWRRAQTELETRPRRRSRAPSSVLLGLCVAILTVASGLGCQARNGDGSDAGVSCACAGIPACDAGTTGRCARHTDCESRACLPDGTCASVADVAYVEAAAPDTTSCTKATPCGHISTALTTGKLTIKLHGTIDENVTVDRGRIVTLLGDPGAALTQRTGGRPVVLATGTGTKLSIYDVTIADAGPSSIGVVMPSSSFPSVALVRVTIRNNPGGGISAAGGLLTIAQSSISSNLGGGITLLESSRFDIVDSVFFANGSLSSATGAITIAVDAVDGNRLEFNTFYDNIAQSGVGAAIQCSAGIFVARNNILYGNGTLASPQQIGGSCGHAYSIVLPGVLPAGPGNKAADPRLINPEAGDFHLGAGSPAIGASDPRSDLCGAAAIDFDGVPRAKPVAIGAFQPR